MITRYTPETNEVHYAIGSYTEAIMGKDAEGDYINRLELKEKLEGMRLLGRGEYSEAFNAALRDVLSLIGD
jgi:hypothetical protein